MNPQEKSSRSNPVQGLFFPPGKEYKPDKSLRMIVNPLAYEVRKIQMLIRACERKLYSDPSKINLRDYLTLLSTHTLKLKQLKATGYKITETETIEGEDVDDTEAMVSEVSLSEEEERLGEEATSSVDIGVSAEDTFAT